MKKLVAIVLMLILGAVCVAEGDALFTLAQDSGLRVDTAENPDHDVRCDYTLSSSALAVMAWSDRAHIYTTSGDVDALSRLYLNALAMGGWESCRYRVGDDIQLSYGTPSRQRCATPEEYMTQVEAALNLQSMASMLSSASTGYVLNKRSRKFHIPDCPAVKKMSAKNREDYIGSRIELIARGYSPCGICNP